MQIVKIFSRGKEIEIKILCEKIDDFFLPEFIVLTRGLSEEEQIWAIEAAGEEWECPFAQS